MLKPSILTGSTTRRVPWRWALVALIIALCSLLFWPGAARWAYDDPYITYRYAANLRAGFGFVYNDGLRVLSTTTPGYTLLLASLSALWSDMPLLSNAIGLLAISLSAGVLIAMLPRELHGTNAALLALLAALLPPAYNALGSEMPLYTLLILLALLAAQRNYPFGAGLLAGLAALARPDGALVAVVVVAAFWRTPRYALRAAVGTVLVAAPWYLFSLQYFGALFPATLAAKQDQLQQIVGSPSFIARLGQILWGYLVTPWYWPAIGLLCYGAWALVRSHALPLLLVWALLYVFSYSALGVSGYQWYTVPLFPALLYLVGYGLLALQQRAIRWSLPGVAASLLLLPPLYAAATGLSTTLANAPQPRAVVYRAAGEWLAANTPPDTTVGAFEVGIIGYHSQRAMVDFAGLIQPEVRQGSGSYASWAAAALARYQPEVVVVPTSSVGGLAAHPEFAPYVPVQVFDTPTYADTLVVYARR
jgi:hypothetical protein